MNEQDYLLEKHMQEDSEEELIAIEKELLHGD